MPLPTQFTSLGFDVRRHEQFLVVNGNVAAGGVEGAEIIVVENWFEEFRDRQDR